MESQMEAIHAGGRTVEPKMHTFTHAKPQKANNEKIARGAQQSVYHFWLRIFLPRLHGAPQLSPAMVHPVNSSSSPSGMML